MASQGANNGQPQAAGQQFVKFSRNAAQRIAKVVRTVEAGDRGQPGVTFDHPMLTGSPFRVATFTGSWSTGTWKTVTLTGTTNTASVYNWCVPVDGSTSSSHSQYVIFGRASGTNSAVEIGVSTGVTCRMTIGGLDVTTLTGYDAGQIQVLGHNTTGPCLQWYSVTTCATSTSA